MVCTCNTDSINFDLLRTLPMSGYQIAQVKFRAKKPKPKTPYEELVLSLTDLAHKYDILMTEQLQRDIPHHWEKHGDLALLPPNCFCDDNWKKAGEELWSVICKCLHCSRVARKDVISTDGFRTPQVKLLQGDTGWVEHKDNRIRYTYDITKCMFSAGNVTEKLRIAKFDCSNETVVDLYAGIGYFTLPYLVHARAKQLHACEWNPDAVEALKKNLQLNGVEDRCTVYQGDNRKICPTHVADRVNLGLIPSSEDGWPVACAALKPTGGIFHVHYNVESKIKQTEVSDINNSFERSESRIKNERDTGTNVRGDSVSKHIDRKNTWTEWAEQTCGTLHKLMCIAHSESKWNISVLHIEHVKSYAPHVDHVVVDFKCCPI
ncbi:tRNA wybutosine-synthesizing protein 2 homolog [Mytilus californianus]|uniref:tRNA wybutosine-synthesizing protein 2 homolog n=1 Tax=Mytilus californianus TaxID=6549 RepID=UPI0022486A99|nr:tRNA wybutosine-synthesizing protein 2 homolog [Mytilus californianus]